VHETAEDLESLQALLDASHASAGPHLRDVMVPERQLDAEELTRLLIGVQILTVACVTAAGRPLVAPVDGLFFRGCFYFGSSDDSVRVANLRRRPAVSAAHTRGEALAVIVHGDAQFIDLSADEHDRFRRALLDTYLPTFGPEWEQFASSAVYARIEPHKMFSAQFT
jgi:nitroimidazol reductase NimA-like FMN-containing flavoprotein (pyridoxamine 5'-phosphate oxidase superfamily)